MEAECKQEVIELHQFFEDWFSAKLAQTDGNYGRMTVAMNPDFHIVGPDGRMMDYPTLEKGLWAGHNSRPNFKLWVDNVQTRPLSNDIALTTYEEWQEIDGQTTARLSTAVFCKKADAPNGVAWMHVHETWMDIGE